MRLYCFNCRMIEKCTRCSKCKGAFYCSGECQKRHWTDGNHKARCMAPLDLDIETANTPSGRAAMITLGGNAEDRNRRLLAMRDASKFWLLPVPSDTSKWNKSGNVAIALDLPRDTAVAGFNVAAVLKTTVPSVRYSDEIEYLPTPVRYYMPLEDSDEGGTNLATMALTSTIRTTRIVAAFGMDPDAPDPLGFHRFENDNDDDDEDDENDENEDVSGFGIDDR